MCVWLHACLVDFQGKILTNIEPPAEINDVSLAQVHKPSMPSMVTPQPAADSGLIMIAGESERIMTFFVPELGMAPKWYVKLSYMLLFQIDPSFWVLYIHNRIVHVLTSAAVRRYSHVRVA